MVAAARRRVMREKLTPAQRIEVSLLTLFIRRLCSHAAIDGGARRYGCLCQYRACFDSASVCFYAEARCRQMEAAVYLVLR